MKGAARPVSADRMLFAVLVLVVAWLPWPFGSNRPWAWAVAEVAVFGALGLALLLSGDVRRALRGVLRDHLALVAFLAAWLAYQWLQTADLGPVLLGRLSPATADIYASAADIAGDRPYSVAFDRGAVIDDLLKNAFYAGLLVMVLMLVRSRKRLLVLAGVVAGTGLLEAGYGLIRYFLTDGLVTSGSFVNRNHYAAFIVPAFAVGLGLLHPASGDTTTVRGGVGHRLRRLFELLMGWRVLLLVVLVVMAAALLLSQSRGALGSLLAGVLLMAGAGAVLRNEVRASGRILVAVALIAVAGAAWFGTGSLGDRLGVVIDEGRERLLLWSFTLDMIRDYPWFGVGADNYAWAITAYRDYLGRAVTVTHAHNDYLELMAEQGIAGALLAGTPVLLAVARMLDAYRQRRDGLLVGILFGALTAATAFLVHAAVEFNFQIPANAAAFFVVLGMGLAAADVGRHPRINPGDEGRRNARRETSPGRRARTAPRTR